MVKLYKVKNRSHDEFYVLADNYGEVEPKLKEWLDKKDWFFSDDRKAFSIELVAEPEPTSKYCGNTVAYLVPPAETKNPGEFPEGSLTAHLKATKERET